MDKLSIPGELKGIELKEVNAEVAKIRLLGTSDPEAAASAERELHARVLHSVLIGAANAAELRMLARSALRTRRFGFRRG